MMKGFAVWCVVCGVRVLLCVVCCVPNGGWRLEEPGAWRLEGWSVETVFH